MPYQIKIPPTKHDNLSLISEMPTHLIEKEKQVPQPGLRPPHMCHGMHMCPQTHIYRYAHTNVIKRSILIYFGVIFCMEEIADKVSNSVWVTSQFKSSSMNSQHEQCTTITLNMRSWN